MNGKNAQMFEIQLGPSGEVVMAGRLDATQCDGALRFLEAVAAPRVIDLARLEYIASSGLRVFLLTQNRVRGSGAGLRLFNVPRRSMTFSVTRASTGSST